VVRGRLEGLGPTTAPALARTLAVPPARVEAALAALQAEGLRDARRIHRGRAGSH